MARNLKTGWVIVATSGATVDGRIIEKEWLEDMAKYYKPSVYKAKLWPDHYRFMPTGGSVLALKTEPAVEPEFEGETHLMAILEPNDWLIEANRLGQYVHTSIEVMENFRGQGHFYLGGLGVTDDPASAGTHELKFKAKTPDQQDVIVFRGADIDVSNAEPEKTSILDRIFGRTNPPQKPQSEDDDMAMTPEQLAEFRKEFKTEILADIKTALAEFSKTTVTDPAPAADPATPPAETELDQFKKAHQDLKEKFDALQQEFNQLKSAPAGGTSVPPTTGAETEQVI